MRTIVTAAATALTLGFLAATPASADAYDQGNQYQQNQQQYQQNGDDLDQPYQGQFNDRGRNLNRKFDFNRHEGNFDRWERGWGNQGFNDFRHQRPLTYWRLVRRLESQGYYGVRNLRQSHFGWGWRAFAFTGRRRPVMLRINPYTGRVLNARYV